MFLFDLPFTLQACVYAAAIIGVLWLLRQVFGPKTNPYKPDMSGKCVIVTGSNTGIGFEAAREFVRLGAFVTLACRNELRGRDAMNRLAQYRKELRKQGHRPGEAVFKQLDLSSLSSIHRFCEAYLHSRKPIHVLLNNAGVMHVIGTPREETKDGFELQLGANHVGHFLLTNLLEDRIRESAPSRVVTVSSVAHEFHGIRWDDANWEEPGSYQPFAAYAQSKLANVLFTQELAARLRGTGVSAFSLHPGVVATELGRNLPCQWLVNALRPLGRGTLAKTPWEGAQTSLYCALAPGIEQHSGQYFDNCQLKPLRTKDAVDPAAPRRLWDLTEEMISGAGQRSTAREESGPKKDK